MSYLVEQPPHCDLLRLSLGPGDLSAFADGRISADGLESLSLFPPYEGGKVVGAAKAAHHFSSLFIFFFSFLSFSFFFFLKTQEEGLVQNL